MDGNDYGYVDNELVYMGDLEPEEPCIIFHQENPKEVMRLEKGYFWYRGEKIEDIHQVYERFNEWLTGVIKYIVTIP